MSKARRIYDRLPISAPVDYEDFERFHPDRLFNLSAGGAFILTPKPFSPNKHVCLRFTLPEISKTPIRACGSVVWTPLQARTPTGSRHPMGMAIEFDNLNQELFHTLDQYVTVSAALRNLDTRIGKELPPHIRATLPKPEGTSADVGLDEPEDGGSASESNRPAS